MGKQSRSRAERRGSTQGKKPARPIAETVALEMDWIDEVVRCELSLMRQTAPHRLAILPNLGLVIFAARTGRPLTNIESWLHQADDFARIVDWSKYGLAAVARIAQSSDPERFDALWVLRRLGVSVADLNLEKATSAPATDEEVLLGAVAALEKVEELCERLWDAVSDPKNIEGQPAFAAPLAARQGR